MQRALTRFSCLPIQAAALGALLVCFFILYWQQRWVQDDAYITFRYGANLASGLGPVFNAGEWVEGYTSWLWMLLSAGAVLLGYTDPIGCIHVVSAVLWWLSFLVLYLILNEILERRFLLVGAALILSLTNYSYNMWFFSGMEVPAVVFLALFLLLLSIKEPSSHRAFLIGALACLLLITRMDMAFLAAGMCSAYMLRIFTQHLSAARTFLVMLLSPLLLCYLPFSVLRLYLYDSFFPNTYFAKMAFSPDYSTGWKYLIGFLSDYRLDWPLLMVPIAALIAPSRVYSWMIPCAASTLLFFFYVVRVGGDFMEWRFLVPAVPLLYCLIAGSAYEIVKRLFTLISRLFPRSNDPTSWQVPTAFVLCIVLLLNFSTKFGTARPSHFVSGQESIPSLAKYAKDPFNWPALGRLLAHILPSDTYISTSAGGMIPFYSGLKTLEVHGLTDSAIARAKVDLPRSGRLGHEGRLWDLNKIRERGVDVHVDWPGIQKRKTPGAFRFRPRNGQEMFSIASEDGFYYDILVLTPQKPIWEFVRRNARIRSFDQRESYVARIPIQALATPVSEGTAWDSPGCRQFDMEISLDLGGQRHVSKLEISLDNNDRYELSFRSSGAVVAIREVPPAFTSGGLHINNINLELDQQIDEIRIAPLEGDEIYAVGHVKLE